MTVDYKFLELEGSTGWIMCKNCRPTMPDAVTTRGPGVCTMDEDNAEDTEVITLGLRLDD
jgi:hypothetical protein